MYDLTQDPDAFIASNAPILHFHPDEGRYCCYPSDAEDLFERFNSDWNQFSKDLSPDTLDPRTPCYYEFWRDEDLVQVRYWFWYRYNRFPGAPFGLGEHLGDWEHVEVRIFPRLTEGPVTVWLLSNHLRARLSSLPSDRTLSGFEPEIPTLDDSHIHVWVALGSHANYPAADSKPYHVSHVLHDRLSARGAIWETKEHLRPLMLTSFASYTGSWGDERAPKGPANECNNRWRNAPDVLPVPCTK